MTTTTPNNSTGTENIYDEEKCEMFGSFGYIIQFILGVLSFMVLVGINV
jgi:hypothetical protein